MKAKRVVGEAEDRDEAFAHSGNVVRRLRHPHLRPLFCSGGYVPRKENETMWDVLLIGLTALFFALAAGYTRACEKL